jgi:hypothetical protein
MLRGFARDGLPVIASIHADSPDELGSLAEFVTETGCRAIELGISCMNEKGCLRDTRVEGDHFRRQSSKWNDCLQGENQLWVQRVGSSHLSLSPRP